ncbi:MAG TPA: hypothetical protein VGQ57_19565 [Polyangiaceae bacterium]|nr:hypothetical protein [Polyangiaceae bacterium]
MKRLLFTGLYAACAIVFLIGVARFYRPGLGFTSMLQFGARFEPRVIPELRHVPRFVVRGAGYDGQFYAQLAAKPQPWDADIQRALDDPTYRSGRIVQSLFAYGLAGGNPARAMHVYAVMNVAIWGVLAWLLLAWFPPGTPWDFACWAGVLFSAGTMMCVCRALPDLAAFVLIVAALRAWERGRRTAASCLLGLAGFMRETSILATAIVLEKPEDRAAVKSTLWRVAVCVTPALALMVALRWIAGPSNAASNNFGVPFVAMLRRFALVAHDGLLKSAGVVATMVSIVAQAGFFAFRWRALDARVRLGLAYLVLFAVTNDAIWEGYPGSAPRVLLPLLFAFNVALPRAAKWWPLLVLGNLSVVTGWHNLTHPPKHAVSVAATPSR